MSGAWLVYRMDGKKPKFLGLYKSREQAKFDVKTMDDDDWLIEFIPFIGWGLSN